ncbi:MAG: M3 family metallopeptidase [Acidobacteriota bacterium]
MKNDFPVNAVGSETNPLLEPWGGPHGGVPPFDRIKVSDFKPALEAGMKENLEEVDRIANNAASPDFSNTIEALERSGRTLSRVSTIFYVWSGVMSDKDFQAVELEMGPALSAFSDSIYQNEKLFKRIETVYMSSSKSSLTAEQRRLTWLYYNNFVRSGAKLGSNEKARLSAINQSLAVLYSKFSQNLLSDENDRFIELKSEADLTGLQPGFREAIAQAAEAKGKKGSWLILNTRSFVEPFLSSSDRRDLRESVWRMFVNRGDNGDKSDTNGIITEVLELRAERANLLGYKTHAHWRVEDAMAKTPEKTMELMEAVWKPAVARVKEEVQDMQSLADKEGAKIKIEPWDYRYYAEKVRKAKYDLDQSEIEPYLQLDKLREGMFWVAGELFGFSFKQVNGIPVYHPDVTVYEVTDKVSGRHIGLWYFDPYARDGKQSGAWMNAYREQQKLFTPNATIVSNNSNFVKGKPGEPVLISWDDAVTLFHEFGHALHGLNSNVTYPSLSGTNVPRDYVEFPSQILERWVLTPEVLQNYALHYKTGKPIPQELVEKIKKAATFNQGFDTVEYLASALVDMKLHLAGGAKIDPDKFERDTLATLGMPREIVMRHRTPQFGHIFSSDGYSAGYYSYLWSDVISADAFGAFTEAAGPYDKGVAKRLVLEILSKGNSVDPAEQFRNFRGRDPKIDALMKKRGFPVGK